MDTYTVINVFLILLNLCLMCVNYLYENYKMAISYGWTSGFIFGLLVYSLIYKIYNKYRRKKIIK
jgi:hypothetical protein